MRLITDLVDKDIATSGKPISILVGFIPFLPFMIFVDGPPLDKYPVLGGLALSLSVGWFSFFLWRLALNLSAQRLGNGRPFGVRRSVFLMLGTVVFIIALGVCQSWFSTQIGWPEAYGFQCYGRGCFFENLAHSSLLLRGGSASELGFFIVLWTIPACTAAVLIYLLVLFRRHRRN